MKYTLVFHESYGHVPAFVLLLIERNHVSPANWLNIEAQFRGNWPQIETHIKTYSTNENYIEPAQISRAHLRSLNP